MINSMTGFGRSENRNDDLSCIIEIKSVNHRYSDMALRLPRRISELEGRIKKRIKTKFSRGYFEVSFTFEDNNPINKELTLNNELAEQYIKAFQELKSRFTLSGEIDINSIIQLKDILKFEDKKVDIEQYRNIIEGALDNALDSLKKMRETEGKVLCDDMLKRINIIVEYAKSIEVRRSSAIIEHKERLRNRIADLLDGHEIDQQRLAEEIAMLAERCDITEELTRLKNHLDQFLKITDENNPVGRKLEFVIQELNRETNTIGSKANDYDISESIIGIKSELEKIREQVQNIE